MKATLYIRIIQLIVPLVFLTALVVLLAVWNSTSKTVHKNIYGTLQTISGALGKEITELAKSKKTQFSLIAQDSFSNDAKAFSSPQSLENIVDTIELDFIVHKSEFDNLLYSNSQSFFSNQKRKQLLDLLPVSNESYITLDNQVYMLFRYDLASPNESDTDILLLGLLLDQQLLTQLSRKSGLHLSLLLPNKNTKAITTINDTIVLPSMLTTGVLSENYWELLSPSVLLGLQTLYTIEKPLTPITGNSASIYLSINAERVSANFVKLQSTIALIALAAVIIAALFGLYVARRISKPLEHMAVYATNIAEGKYDTELESFTYSREFRQLNDAFEKMRDSISAREGEIVKQTKRDFLTPLYNRRYIKNIIENVIAENREFQAIIFHINDFQSIHHVFGNDCADYCLIEVAKRIESLKGVAAKLDGSRYFWLSDVMNQEQQLENIKQRLEAPINYEGNIINISMAMGLLKCPEQAADIETLIRRLVIVVETSIESKSEIVHFEQALENSFQRRLDIVTKLKNALANNTGELSIAYQPFISLKDNSCKNLEALLRWENPELGIVPPIEFIPLAEEAGLINEISRWVIKHAMTDVNRFQQNGLQLHISINISPYDLMNKEFPVYCKQQLKKHGLLGDSIYFELTESSLLKDPEEAIKNLEALKSIGFKIAIDDFGTGYSSLSYLTSLPADIIKIDRSFVKSLTSSSNDGKTMCRRVIQIAQDLGLTIVAEGIEEYMSLQWLSENACDFGQGYHICTPRPFDETLLWFKTTETTTPLLP